MITVFYSLENTTDYTKYIFLKLLQEKKFEDPSIKAVNNDNNIWFLPNRFRLIQRGMYNLQKNELFTFLVNAKIEKNKLLFYNNDRIEFVSLKKYEENVPMVFAGFLNNKNLFVIQDALYNISSKKQYKKISEFYFSS